MLEQFRYINLYESCCEMSATQETTIRNYINEINPEQFKNYLEIIKANILEDFELKEPIGSGSESIVYKGICKKNGTSFALKMILNSNRDEFKILSKLKR